jgi:hypothetical protein
MTTAKTAYENRNGTPLEYTKCHPGDVCVQRGTMHGWYNPSKTCWARWITFAIIAEPVRLEGGQILDKVFHPDWPATQVELTQEHAEQIAFAREEIHRCTYDLASMPL